MKTDWNSFYRNTFCTQKVLLIKLLISTTFDQNLYLCTSKVLLEFDFDLYRLFFQNKELIWNVAHSLLEWSRKWTSSCARKHWFFQRSLWQGIFFIPPCIWNSQRHPRGSWFCYSSFWQIWSIQVTFLEILNTLYDFQEILKSVHFKNPVARSSFLSKLFWFHNFSICCIENGHNFERNEGCATVFLRWRDFGNHNEFL